uniref:Uncharacterized protein n=1 Tax=Palpitomonas bilix TaxID=652834 RepID=A0A7S3DE62_9EUKA
MSGRSVGGALSTIQRRIERIATVVSARLLMDVRDLGTQTEITGEVEVKKEKPISAPRRRASIDAAVGEEMVMRFEQLSQTDLQGDFEVKEPFTGVDYGTQTEDKKKQRVGDDRDNAVEEMLDLMDIGTAGPLRTALKFLGQLHELALKQGIKGIYSWPRFILNFFVKMFGLQSIAEKHCANFLTTISEESKLSKDHRLKTFLRLASVSEELPPISMSGANVYMAVLEELQKRYRILAAWDRVCQTLLALPFPLFSFLSFVPPLSLQLYCWLPHLLSSHLSSCSHIVSNPPLPSSPLLPFPFFLSTSSAHSPV